MKSLRLKIVVTIFAFSLGIASVWAIGGFSYLASLFEQTLPVSETSPHISEISPEPKFVKIENAFALENKPRFEDYPVVKVYKSKFAPLKYQDDEFEYKVRLQWAIENQEIDFAGHYIATNWSCGMWYSVNAFIDVKTGKVYWSPVGTEVCLPHLENEFVCDENFTNVEYRIDSKLIVFFEFRYDNNPDEGEKGFHYYKFENGRFIHLKSILVKEQRSARQIQLDEFDEKNT
ncbi:MAG TPA: hypothetical protein VNI84_18640 [Pyrinomonadaceae bacterium]|nr:hypothetical protein [Pyrinomonadaceae bacterium]